MGNRKLLGSSGLGYERQTTGMLVVAGTRNAKKGAGSGRLVMHMRARTIPLHLASEAREWSSKKPSKRLLRT